MTTSDTRYLTSDIAQSTLGIIAGSGRLPIQLIDACKKTNRPVFVLAFEHAVDAHVVALALHAIVRIGAIGEAISHLRNAGVKEVVMAGTFKRPPLSNLMPDGTGAKLLAHIGTAFFSGDDTLLKKVIGFLEAEGFSLIGAETILEDLLTPAGVLGSVIPEDHHHADIAYGFAEAKRLGERDMGQAVVVCHGKTLGTEDAHGTDALLARVGKAAAGGVLVKAKKPQQDTRVDLPSIGVQTIEKAHQIGLAGIAVEAHGSLILDRDEVIAKADALGLFVVGVTHA